MQVASLHTYPVKGCRRIDHDEAHVEPCGLAGDRRWMIVDPDGVGITQRDQPILTRLTVDTAAGGLHLRAPGRPSLTVGAPTAGETTPVRVFRHKPPVPARVAASAAEWLTGLVGRPARLVWLGDPTARPVLHNGVEGDRVSLADAYPLLLTSTSSLDAVNDWLVEGGDEPVPMSRFRPNVVVSGAQPWAEDGWLGGRLRIGATAFRAVKPCDRCLVTTIDQDTGEAGKQPLRVLGKYRRLPDGLIFGLNLIPDLPTGVIRVGDPVVIHADDTGLAGS